MQTLNVMTFCSNAAIFVAGAFLCFFIVWDRVKPPRWRALLVAVLGSLLFCGLYLVLPEQYVSLCVPLFLVGSFFYCRHTVGLSPGKLAFIVTMIAEFTFTVFCLRYVLYGCVVTAATVWVTPVVMLAALPIMLLFCWHLRPIIVQMGLREWRRMWFIPLTFMVIMGIVTFCIRNIAAGAHLIMIGFVAFGAAVTCNLLLSSLKESEDYVREAEKSLAIQSFIAWQEGQYRTIAESIAETNAARHDLRHQLTALRGYLTMSDLEGALRFCDELTANIPVSYETKLCDNFAVNAIALYYQSLARQEGVEVSLRLLIPESAGRIEDHELCVIVGNLLENAVRACRQVKEGERFIKMRARSKRGYLTIVMDNSFVPGDNRAGTSPPGEGIGLPSIRAVAKKYDGSTKFETDGNVFLSSVMLRMKSSRRSEKTS